MVCPREADRILPGKAGEFAGIDVSGEQCGVGSEAAESLLDIGVAYGAGYAPIVSFVDVFGSLGQDSDVGELARRLAEEDGFPLVGLNESDGAVRAQDGYRESGETGSRTDVGDAEGGVGQVRGEKDGLAVMPFDGISFVADGA